ncbi:UNVERIFIED_CONTAM: hypothetical protein RMT77_014189 [Armadillidium vulgare]
MYLTVAGENCGSWKYSQKSRVNSPPFQTLSHVSGYEDDLQHECYRDCHGDKQIKKCYYTFKAEFYTTMSKACYDCPFNLTDCLRPHCVVGDGLERTIMTINRRLPGPTIHVCENDEVIVDVINDLGGESTTMHWHGIHQIGTPYMDGVPMLNQCPIFPGHRFRYHFLANPDGTHFWHSHTIQQEADGIFGTLIVRSRNNSQRHLYDVDDPEHTMMITDWMDALAVYKISIYSHNKLDAFPHNILINGMGRYKPLENGNKTVLTPLYEYKAKRGLRYLFRAISIGIESCPIEISVQNHTLLVIASDVKSIQPLEVDSLVIFGGERFDFVINANQKPGTYFIKYKGLRRCEISSAHQVAVLRYEGQTGFPNTPEEVDYDFTTPSEGLQLNKLNSAPGDLKTFYTVADMRISPNNKEDITKYATKPDHKFFIEFDLYAINNEWFHHEEFYPYSGVDEDFRVKVPLMNFISFRLPNVPPLSQPNEVNQTLYCNSSTISNSNCETEFCRCTHVLNVELGSLVEIILIDTGTRNASHPFHLHGYDFAVLGMGIVEGGATLQKVQDLDKRGKLIRNLKDFPFKDTVSVPSGGYTIIRFRALNPGFWLFHCHILFHLSHGMSLVFHVGEQEDLPPVPPGFPKCSSFIPKPAYNLTAKILNRISDPKFGEERRKQILL